MWHYLELNIFCCNIVVIDGLKSKTSEVGQELPGLLETTVQGGLKCVVANDQSHKQTNGRTDAKT